MYVLLVEDEPKIASFVCNGLRQQGWVVDVCDSGETGYTLATTQPYDVAVLDIMLPGKSGLTVLRDLRAMGCDLPVLLLTARNELNDRLEGLRQGADDYLAKPFYVEELAARLQAIVRRRTGVSPTLAVGPWRLDPLSRQVSGNGTTLELTTREFNLLAYLMGSPGRVFTRTQILEHVWGYDFDPGTNMVDVAVQRLRKKLAQAETDPWIESVRGVGYRFRQPDGAL